jgi:hypothetical protein
MSILDAPFIWIKSMEAKIEWKLTWDSCICCNPAKGRKDCGGSLLIKPSFVRMKKKACQLTRTNKKGFIG